MFRQSSRDGEDKEALQELRALHELVEELMRKEMGCMTIGEAMTMVNNGSSDEQKVKGLRALARLATHGPAEQVEIASGDSLPAVVKCMKDNLGSARIQRAGCVLIVNLARQTRPASYGEDGIHPAPLTVAHHQENVASHAGPLMSQSQQSDHPPWLRRTIVDAGGVDVILGMGEELGCMGEYTTRISCIWYMHT